MNDYPIINFDQQFASYTSQWLKDHQGEYKNYDEMESDIPRIYLSFLNTRADWLSGITPGAYFTQYEDPKVLVDWLISYCRAEIPVPDLLTEQIENVGKPCEKRLLELLKDEENPEEARMLAVSILRDLGSELPKMLYITWQMNRNEKDELKDHALESLTEMGKKVVQPILQNIQSANQYGQEALMEVLSHFPGDERILHYAMKLFQDAPDNRALMAGYLARLGDERALPLLTDAAQEPGLRYLTYIEIRNAIEMLGGECPERVFDEDPEYDALRDLE